MTARSDAATTHSPAMAGPPSSPVLGREIAITSPKAVAWAYGALLDRGAIRGLPRDPEVRREVETLRRSLMSALSDDMVEAEVDGAAALEHRVHRAA